jgi:hypothetical protein
VEGAGIVFFVVEGILLVASMRQAVQVCGCARDPFFWGTLLQVVP